CSLPLRKPDGKEKEQKGRKGNEKEPLVRVRIEGPSATLSEKCCTALHKRVGPGAAPAPLRLNRLLHSDAGPHPPDRRSQERRMAHTGNLGDLIDRSRDLDKVALIDLLEEARPRQVTYRELDAEADAVARALVARGIRRGERVAILAVNRTEFLAAYLGIMRAGMVAVPVNHKFPRETIGFILADCDAKLVFADAERAPMAPAHLPLVSFDDAGPHGYAAFLDQGPFETVRPAKDEIAMFLYTSGSTGRPKGVPLTHFGHLWVVRTRGRGADVSGHRFLVAAPLYHMN